MLADTSDVIDLIGLEATTNGGAGVVCKNALVVHVERVAKMASAESRRRELIFIVMVFMHALAFGFWILKSNKQLRA